MRHIGGKKLDADDVINDVTELSLQGTLDVGMIDSVCASDNPER